MADDFPVPASTLGRQAPPKIDLERELLRLRSLYHDELERDHPTPQTQFELAWCLTCCPNREDVKEGIELFQELVEAGFNRPDCLYFLALAHFRLGEFSKSKKRIDTLLKLQPNHRPAYALQTLIVEKTKQEGVKGILLFAGLTAGVMYAVKQYLSSERY